MGQTSSLPWCCCGRDKRASLVLNDSLQEKLLPDNGDEAQSKTTSASVLSESPETDPHRHSRGSLSSKHSSPRDAGTATGMMPLGVESEDDESDGRASRDRMDEEDDERDEDANHKSFRSKKQLSSSYRPSVNEWDLARDSAFGVDSEDAQVTPLDGDRILEEEEEVEETRGSLTRIARGISDASNRDSYASARELLETTHEGDEEGEDDDLGGDDDAAGDGKEAAAEQAVLRRRQLPRPTSSRVFDDDLDAGRLSSQSSASRGLRELAEQDAESEDFGSYGSGSSSMTNSFLRRHSDVDSSGVSLVESGRTSDGASTIDGGDNEVTTAPPSGRRSPRHSGSKKKGKKRR